MNNFNKGDSFEIIHQMINTARKKICDNSFFYLLWGWTTLVCSLLQYALIKTGYEKHYMVWPALTTAATVTHIWHGVRMGKTTSTKSYLDEYIKILWLCIWGAMCLGFALGWYVAGSATAYMILILLCGLGTLITGILIRFMPLILGGIIAWLSCINLAFLKFPDTLPVLAIAIAFCYIIPGHLLRIRSKNGV